jgi:drug/metabolite transporter (DMT)-like permease
MNHHRDSFDTDVSSSIAMMGVFLGIFLFLLAAFLIVVAIVFVVRTFVKYPEKRKTLWIAFAGCIASCIGAGLLYKLTATGGSFALVCIGVAVLLITCLAVDLKNRDTLMRENVNLIDEVLHTPWWGSEDTPQQEQKVASIAA